MTMIKIAFDSVVGVFTPPFRKKEIIEQLFFVGNKSLPIILFCVVFAAIVIILESSFHMKLIIKNDSMVPGFATLLILRELGVVITSLLLTSRVGAGYASEIGTMKVTEQIDAIKMLGIDPVLYLVVPRLIACILGAIMLTIIANVVCIFSAMIVSEFYLGYTPSVFFSFAQRFAQAKDLVFAVVKAACFGAVIPLVAAYFGFHCQPGAEGVGKATTQSVVVSSITIIVFDFILSYAFSYMY